MKTYIPKTDIDLVYLWVDGSDPRWLAKRNAFIGTPNGHSDISSNGRYDDNGELKYSLRSIGKYAPWIRKIFIVTDNQTPNWLDVTNPRIKIIDHREIIPEVGLPCFNSTVIEYFIHKIPDLSEFFLFANDDMFFNAALSPEFFFASDGFPIVRLIRKPLGKWHYRAYRQLKLLAGKEVGIYQKMIADASLLVEKTYGKYYSGIPHHNIDSFKKSDFSDAMEQVFSEQVEKSLCHHVRHADDVHRSIISYYMLAIGHGHIKYVNKRESMRISAHKPDFMKRLIRRKPKLFCLNDSQRVKDSDRSRIKPFLEELFSEKSVFEKQ
jgi:hypothetical protein